MMNEIWETIKYGVWIDEICDQSFIDFAVNIYLNDFKYVKENYKCITTDYFKQKCCMIAVSYSNVINMIVFLFSKYKVDVQSREKYYETNLLMLACNNKSLKVIK